MGSPAETIETYFHAKDGNRPFLMRRAFAATAELVMVVRTDAITFPAHAEGVAAIEDILGRRFADDFENVPTFCLSRPTEADRQHFACRWMVGMSEKGNGPIRVGCGRYDWYFTADESCLARRLVITIEVMRVVPAEAIDDVMGWLTDLPYPWCPPELARESMPALPGLEVVSAYLSSSVAAAA